MKSLASLLVLAALQVPPAPPPGTPSGSSERSDASYDTVGRIALDDGAGVRIVAATGLPDDSVVEVTALDTGRTIVALAANAAPPAGRVAALTAAAASALGIADGALVRIRRTAASAPELVALRAGQAAEPRADAPQALLVGLRRRVTPGQPPAAQPTPGPAVVAPTRPGAGYAPPAAARTPTAGVSPSPRPAPTPVVERPRPQPTPVARPTRPRPVPTSAPARRAAPEPVGQTPRYYVQVAALSDPARAQVLAYSLGGRVEGQRPWRVRMGPYVTREAAESGRAVAVRRGHRDARIFTLR